MCRFHLVDGPVGKFADSVANSKTLFGSPQSERLRPTKRHTQIIPELSFGLVQQTRAQQFEGLDNEPEIEWPGGIAAWKGIVKNGKYVLCIGGNTRGSSETLKVNREPGSKSTSDAVMVIFSPITRPATAPAAAPIAAPAVPPRSQPI